VLLALRLAMVGGDGSVAASAGNPSRPDDCRTDRLSSEVGKLYSPKLAEKARRLASAKLVRKLHPGSIPTADFRRDRLNIHVDAFDVVIGFSCR
jgi:hypothetical protein